jgi:hypothetical protein
MRAEVSLVETMVVGRDLRRICGGCLGVRRDPGSEHFAIVPAVVLAVFLAIVSVIADLAHGSGA